MNRDAVRIVGINAERLSAVAFGSGIGLAAASGVLVAMVFPSFSPFMGNDYTLIGFIVIVLGGLGHPVGRWSARCCSASPSRCRWCSSIRPSPPSAASRSWSP